MMIFVLTFLIVCTSIIYTLFLSSQKASLIYNLFFSNKKENFNNDEEEPSFEIKKGYKAVLVNDGIGKGAQHMAIYKNLIYVKLMEKNPNGNTIIILNDKFEIVDEFCKFVGTCIQIRGKYLYTGGPNNIYRYEINEATGKVYNKDEPKLIVRGVQSRENGDSPIFIIDNDNNLYLHIISRTNACQSINNDRKVGFKGEMPCARLKLTSCIWKFDANKTNQTLDMGELYSTGLRCLKSLVVRDGGVLYGIIQGRDSLHELYPQYYNKEEGDTLAPDELVKIERNTNFGFPYCYWDSVTGRRKLMPEYGGDGKNEAHCNSLIDKPITVFNNHNGPNDLLFSDNKFYIAWNGKPKPLECDTSCDTLTVDTFQLDDDFKFTNYETIIKFAKKAATRPSGLVMTSDNELLISDSIDGKIWKISKIF